MQCALTLQVSRLLMQTADVAKLEAERAAEEPVGSDLVRIAQHSIA